MSQTYSPESRSGSGVPGGYEGSNKQPKISPDTEHIIKKSYFRLLPVQILGIVIVALNGFIDSLITSRSLGTHAVAAIGLFSPVATVIGITWVITIGVLILCSHDIGAGKKDDMISLFSTGVLVLSVFSLLVTAFCMIMPEFLAVILKSDELTSEMLISYIRGYAPGVIGQVLSGVLMVFLPFNNNTRRSYYGIAVMIILNVGIDILNVTVLQWGTFGMGLATSISYLVSSTVMLVGFLGKEKTIHLRFTRLSFDRIPSVIKNGLPSLVFTIGCTAKGYIMNISLMHTIGAEAVAVMNVQNGVISILGAIPLGCAAALLTLASVYYGDEDRESLVLLTKIALTFGLLLSVISVALLMGFSTPISSLFFGRDDPAWMLTRRMLLLFPNFLILNLFVSCFTKIYQCQGKTLIVNMLTLAEPLGAGVIAVLLQPFIGADGAWISFSLSEVLCLIAIALSVFAETGSITPALTDWMKLPADFGAPEEDCMEFSVHTMEDLVQKSYDVMDFCLSRQIDRRRSKLARLSIEEMVGNVITHGFKTGKKHSVDVRVVAGDLLTIRIRDDCRAFDPSGYLDQFSDEDPLRFVGLRLIAGIAKEMTYQNNAGINTLQIKV